MMSRGDGAVRISDLPWWDLAEVATADARIFGATAWTVQYYWAVAAQPGTAMFAARLGGGGGATAESAESACVGAVSEDVGAEPQEGADAESAYVDAESHEGATGDAFDDMAGEIVGWIVMSATGAEADVMTIATTERARGRGVGRALLDAGFDWASDQGAEVVHLEVDEGNAAALGLYRAFGFVEWERRPDYYPGADAILMRRRTR